MLTSRRGKKRVEDGKVDEEKQYKDQSKKVKKKKIRNTLGLMFNSLHSNAASSVKFKVS